MVDPIHFRIFGHVISLVLHLGNSAAMLIAFHGEIAKRDEEVQKLASMQSEFLTVWNVVFQLFYSSLSLTCDVLTILNKDDILPKYVQKFRHIFFESIVFPGTVLIFLFFWPVYIYDRSLIFPEFIDRVLSQNSNYIIHIFIVPVVLWEVAFLPKSAPKSHKNNLQILAVYHVLYTIATFYTYTTRGIWPYPLIELVYGTVYYLVLHVIMSSLTLIGYYSQWAITKRVWGQEAKIRQKLL